VPWVKGLWKELSAPPTKEEIFFWLERPCSIHLSCCNFGKRNAEQFINGSSDNENDGGLKVVIDSLAVVRSLPRWPTKQEASSNYFH
jgi:hypothetical protein